MAQDGRLEEAIGVWQSLAEDSPPGSPWPELLQEQIARAAGELGIEPPTLARPEEPGPRGPTAGDVHAAPDTPPEDREAFIRSIAATLAARLAAPPPSPYAWPRPPP